MALCYHCGSERHDPHYHDGLPYCGLCAIKFGYLDGAETGDRS